MASAVSWFWREFPHTKLHFLHPVLSLTCCPSCSPWWKASRSQPAGHPSDYSPARLSVRHHNNQAHGGAECPSSASVGTAVHTHSIASTSVRTPRPGSYLEHGTHRKKTEDYRHNNGHVGVLYKLGTYAYLHGQLAAPKGNASWRTQQRGTSEPWSSIFARTCSGKNNSEGGHPSVRKRHRRTEDKSVWRQVKQSTELNSSR